MVLQSIRERLTGVLAFLILGILVIPFAFVGINSYFTTGAENLVARINDKEITTTEFTQNFSNYRRRMQSIMGAAFDPEQFESLLAKREFLDNLITQELLRQAALDIKLDLDNERLAEQIRNMQGFQVEGEFNLDIYLSRLSSQGLSVKQFEREVREQFATNQLPNSLFSSSITTSSELQDFVRLQDQQRSFKAVLIPPIQDAEAASPADDIIQAYYDEHQTDYQSEEMVTIEYLELNVLDIPSGTEPDEEFLQNRFEAQKGRFISPEQRRVSHILVEFAANADEAVKETARQEAQDVTDRARDGEDFAALAAEFSDDIGSAEFGGDLGWLEPGVMSDSFENALYELSMESSVSDPVQTGFGWHVIQLQEIQAASGMSYEEARATLIQENQEEESEREFLEKADRLVDIIYEDPTNLDAAALDLGLDVQHAGPFSRTGGDGIAGDPAILNAAFSELVLLQRSVSDPVDLDENHLVMIRVSEHFPVATRPLDEVREDIAKQILSDQSLADAKMRAEQLLASWNEEGVELESLAEQGEYEFSDHESATRSSTAPDTKVVEAVFGLDTPAEGENVPAVVEAADGYALVVLASVTPGSLEEGAVLNEQQYNRLIANAAANIEVAGLLRQLRELSDVEVYEDRLR